MKTFLKTVAWIGSVIMISGAAIAFRESWILYFRIGHDGVLLTYLVTFWVCLTGLALMLIGGLFSNPRFFLDHVYLRGYFLYCFPFLCIHPGNELGV